MKRRMLLSVVALLCVGFWTKAAFAAAVNIKLAPQIHGNAKRGQSKGPGRGKVLKNGLCTPPLPLNTEISSRSHNNPVSVGSHPHPLSAIGPAFSCSFQRDSQFLELPVRSQKPTPHNSPFHLQHHAARMAHHTPYARVKQKSQRPGTVTPQRFRQKQTL